MKEYVFNDCSICLNPDYYGTKSGGRESNCIRVALCDNGLWSMGYSWQTTGGTFEGGGGGCSRNGEFDSSRNAVIAGIKYMQKIIKTHRLNKEQYAGIQECIDIAYSQVSQLSLF